MNTINMTAICTVLVLLAGCASEPERPEPPEGYFATYIEPDGSKKFQYTMELPERSSGRSGGRPGKMGGHVSGSSGRGMSGGVTAGSGRRPPSGSSGGNERFEQINARLENSLETELARSGFCHSGHRETERVTKPPTIYIRGECSEKANDEDRKRFPNNLD